MSRVALLTVFALGSGLVTGCAMLDDECYDEDVYEAEYRRERLPRPHDEEQPADRPERRRSGPGIYRDKN